MFSFFNYCKEISEPISISVLPGLSKSGSANKLRTGMSRSSTFTIVKRIKSVIFSITKKSIGVEYYKLPLEIIVLVLRDSFLISTQTSYQHIYSFLSQLQFVSES